MYICCKGNLSHSISFLIEMPLVASTFVHEISGQAFVVTDWKNIACVLFTFGSLRLYIYKNNRES